MWNAGKRLSPVVITYSPEHSKEDIHQSQAGNRAANKRVLQHGLRDRVMQDPAGIEPIAAPGQGEKNQPNDHAKENIDKRKQALQPYRRQGFFLCGRRARRRFEIRGS